ncbi:PREDICTED: putative E3 ubiquitin-protein ligase RING1a [Ipomoea nil]|uniref:putative E3 ubiquitin-protein ligase RING1a n=1 Tax=Ipomoea nil TaxID=35883 RepID=UPI000901C3BA|nr:PREDICTED: putative E3 ubiquitin-protein ligase RING1a [Ipomoea nil]
MAAERRDENEEQEGEFPLKNGGSGSDEMGTDSAVILDDLMESRTEIRDWLECPICLGIIKKTRTVVECMHRFCGDCIEHVMEKGMNDCPICRCHIPSRASLKDDANFDGLVGAVCKLVEKCGYNKRKAPTDDDECGKQTKVRRIIGAPSNQTSSSSDSRFSEPKQDRVLRRE